VAIWEEAVRRRARTVVAAAAALVLAVTLAACGGGNAAGSGTSSTTPQANNGPLPAADPSAPGEIIMKDDFPDPWVVQDGNTIYAYSSNITYTAVPYRTAPSIHGPWSSIKIALPNLPSWAEFGHTWRPAVHQFGPKWVMYFTARENSTKEQCLGQAIADAPSGPFVPTADAAPFLCQHDQNGSLDGRIVFDAAGNPWLTWKDDNLRARKASNIYSQQLTADGLSFVGDRHILLTADPTAWTGPNVEAPQLVSDSQGRWWLFLSAGWVGQTNYAVTVTRCQGVIGPCEPVGAPFLTSNSQGAGPGEQSTWQDSQGRWWLIYNSTNLGIFTDNPPPRPVALARLDFSGATPTLAKVTP
jgi:beta-xylosidase